MGHETALIAIVASGLGLAFVFGLLATRLRLPPILGYLVAGLAIGPFTPGFVADAGLASQLAELGVIFLMFGVGLHFSLGDLLSVRRIAVPGALTQIAVATGLGTGLALLWGWPWGAGLVFGLSLSDVIVEQSRETAESLRERGLPVIYGDATRPEVLAHAHLERARMVVVAAPDAYQARAILEVARRINPDVDVVVRTHSDEERAFLEQNGATQALVGERELAVSLARAALKRSGVQFDMEEVAARALHPSPPT